ncbi:hypothetical protein [Peribacillus kribbensis]|uniref:hypothetical protein n=1 Tax=Peribacillus kribbensis TaxID=356658 RepID=UPI000426F00A|nr:hypothetical protein [Peribacillus kribbensis]
MNNYRVFYSINKHNSDDINSSVIVNSVGDTYEIMKLGRKQITRKEGILSQNISITKIALI